MKIAYFVSYLPPHVGGIEVVAENQIKALVASGQKLSVLTSACGTRPGAEDTNGCTIHRIPAWNYFEEKMGAVFPIFAPSLIWQSYKAVKEADIVHAHDAFYLTSLSAAIWARILRKPLIVTQHVDMIPHPNLMVKFAQKLVYATTGNFILRTSDSIIVLNSRVKDFLVNRGINERKIIFLPNGVDTGVFSPTTDKQKKVLRQKYKLPEDKILALFVGRFVPKKGFMKLFQLDPIKGVAFVFAGGYAPNNCTQRTDQYFLGPVSRSDMPDIFRMCDIFVLPSEGEGFPVTVQEAMASGMAVITTDDPAYNAYNLRDCIFLINPDSQSIASSLQRLASDRATRNSKGRAAQRYAIANFSWHVNITRLINLYSGVLI